MKNEALTENRIDYLDGLRILATLAVVVIHTASQNWFTADVRSYEWQVFNLYDSLTRWAVPVFVMISGALFLGSTKSIGTILKKNVLRILTAFFFWSAVYALKDAMKYDYEAGKALSVFWEGPYHLWFLFMIVGLYFAVPVLRKIAESETVTKYFLTIALIVTALLPQVISCVNLVSKEWGSMLGELLGRFQFKSFAGYAFYFLGGYYLNRVDMDKKQRRCIYIAGICGAVLTLALSAAASLLAQEPTETFYNDCGFSVACTGAAVFVFGKYHFFKGNRSRRLLPLVKRLSKYSFGVYLVHVLVIDLLGTFGDIHTLRFNPLLSVPVLSVLVSVISFAISGVIHRIPVLKKYVV